MKKVINILLVLVLNFIFINLSFADGIINIFPLKDEINANLGDVIEKTIMIENNTNEEIEGSFSKTNFESKSNDGIPSFVKNFNYLKNPDFQLTERLEIPSEIIKLLPGEKKEIKYKIIIPKDGKIGGHYGAIFFTPSEKFKENNIEINIDYGSLILLNVEGTSIYKNINLENVHIYEKNNYIFFDVLLKNNGNTHIKPTGTIILFDNKGNQLTDVGNELVFDIDGNVAGERIADYLSINDVGGNVLPNSERYYSSKMLKDISDLINQEIKINLNIQYEDENGITVVISDNMTFINKENLDETILSEKNEDIKKEDNLKNIDYTKLDLKLENIYKKLEKYSLQTQLKILNQLKSELKKYSLTKITEKQKDLINYIFNSVNLQSKKVTKKVILNK